MVGRAAVVESSSVCVGAIVLVCAQLFATAPDAPPYGPLANSVRGFIDHAHRSVAREARVRPFLDKVFNVAKGSSNRPYNLECDQEQCAFDVIAPVSWDCEWMDRFQHDLDGVGLFGGFTMIGCDNCMFGLNEPGMTAGIQMAARFEKRFRESPELAACKAQHPEPGRLEIEIHNNLRTRARSYSITGSLAKQPIAVCISRVLDEMIAAHPMPNDVTWAYAEEPLYVRVP